MNEEYDDNLEYEDEEEFGEESGSTIPTSEYDFPIKIGAVFAFLAVVLVLLIGIFSGVTIGTILWRFIIGGAIFFLFGFGVGFLLKMFVPEITTLNTDFQDEDLGGTVDLTADDDQAEKEIVDNSFYQNGQEDQGQLDLGKKGNLGDFNIPDDPKLLAEGVRTMLSKDD